MVREGGGGGAYAVRMCTIMCLWNKRVKPSVAGQTRRVFHPVFRDPGEQKVIGGEKTMPSYLTTSGRKRLFGRCGVGETLRDRNDLIYLLIIMCVDLKHRVIVSVMLITLSFRGFERQRDCRGAERKQEEEVGKENEEEEEEPGSRLYRHAVLPHVLHLQHLRLLGQPLAGRHKGSRVRVKGQTLMRQEQRQVTSLRIY